MNQSGQLTFDFMISIVVSFGLFMLFFAMTYTFTTVEVAQYVSFAAARAQAGAGKTADSQAQAAQAKITQLTKTTFQTQFNNPWFTFGANPKIKSGYGNASSNQGTFASQLGKPDCIGCQYEKVFTGVSIPFKSQLLSLKIPFLSNSSAQDEESGFQTNVNAILIRDPSMDECQSFWKLRLQKMQSAGLPNASLQGKIQNSSYFVMEDNGC